MNPINNVKRIIKTYIHTYTHTYNFNDYDYDFIFKDIFIFDSNYIGTIFRYKPKEIIFDNEEI